AVIDLFEGALLAPAALRIGQAPGATGHEGFQMDQTVLGVNLRSVTQREGGPVRDSLELLTVEELRGKTRSFPNFSVEMETGTGKTYVYVATALRLAELYGLRKFIILVHSVAIRAGVSKTFEQTYEHFRAKFPSVP